MAEIKPTIAHELEQLRCSIKAADPTLTDQVIMDLYKQITSIIERLKKPDNDT